MRIEAAGASILPAKRGGMGCCFARFMKYLLPVAIVVAALIVLWYIACLSMNAQLQRDRYANGGNTTYSWSDFIIAEWNMERPRNCR